MTDPQKRATPRPVMVFTVTMRLSAKQVSTLPMVIDSEQASAQQPRGQQVLGTKRVHFLGCRIPGREGQGQV